VVLFFSSPHSVSLTFGTSKTFYSFLIFSGSQMQLSVKCTLLVNFGNFHTFPQLLTLFGLVRRTSQKGFLQVYRCTGFTRRGHVYVSTVIAAEMKEGVFQVSSSGVIASLVTWE
jgi:hypothetical protein